MMYSVVSRNPAVSGAVSGSHYTINTVRLAGSLITVHAHVGVVSPVAVLTGHEQSVACVSLCSTLGLVVSVAAKCECVSVAMTTT